MIGKRDKKAAVLLIGDRFKLQPQSFGALDGAARSELSAGHSTRADANANFQLLRDTASDRS